MSSLLHHINNIEPSICFTVEHESKRGSLPFLDVLEKILDFSSSIFTEDDEITFALWSSALTTDNFCSFG